MKADPYLERRHSGYFWRRRCPAPIARAIKPTFFCFALRTYIPSEAAEIARRITATSEICFKSVGRLQPEVIAQILTGYARLEIEMADRVRAYAPVRSREAAEAAMQIEAASRHALMDAIFLCDKSPALEPIMATAQKLGLQVDTSDADYPLLADRMLRLMIDVSMEKERRGRGQFSEPQPWLQNALHHLARGDAHSGVTSTNPPVPTRTTQAVTQPELSKSSTGKKPYGAAPAQRDIAKDKKLKIGNTTYRTDTKAGNCVSADDDRSSLLDLFDLYVRSREAGEMSTGGYAFNLQGAGEKFKKNVDTTIASRTLLERHFKSRPASGVTIADMHEFSQLLTKLPKNQGKLKEHKGKSLTDIIKMADAADRMERNRLRRQLENEGLSESEINQRCEKVGEDRLSPRTVQRHQQTISSMLDFAVSKGKLNANPMKELVFSDHMIHMAATGKADTSRKLWNPDFPKLMASKHWQDQSKGIVDSLFWAPIIAILHGMRSEEILQLAPTDVKCDGGVYFFDIRQGDDQQLKSDSARRSIPIHKALLELGFMSLVEKQKAADVDRIFGDIRRAKSGRKNYTANFTKVFTAYRRANGLYNEGQDFHALRTTFHSNLVANGIPDTVRNYLMGHVNKDMGITNYLPEGFPIARLKEFIDILPFDLSGIKRRYSEAEYRVPLRLVKVGT